MLGKKSSLSILLKILLYGVINVVVVLGLVSITKFNSGGEFQKQLIEIAIIVCVTGLVDYIVITKKLF